MERQNYSCSLLAPGPAEEGAFFSLGRAEPSSLQDAKATAGVGNFFKWDKKIPGSPLLGCFAHIIFPPWASWK